MLNCCALLYMRVGLERGLNKITNKGEREGEREREPAKIELRG